MYVSFLSVVFHFLCDRQTDTHTDTGTPTSWTSLEIQVVQNTVRTEKPD